MAEDCSQPPRADADLRVKLHQLEEDKVSLVSRITDLQTLIGLRDREIQSQKLGKDGMETVTRLLQETQKDLNSAKKKNKVLDIGMRNLQTRLEQNGLNSSIELEEQEMYIPGPSKQVMDNLMKENARLRLASNTNLDFDEMHSLKLRIQDLEDTIERLERENEELTQKAGARHTGNRIEQVNTAHRMQIDKMDEQIRRLEQERREQAEEAAHLQQQLNIIQATPTIVSEMNVDESEEIQRFKQANEKLSFKCKELMEMNLRWKSYDSQREVYVKQIRGELDAAKTSLAETQQQTQNLLTASRQQLEKTLADKSTLEAAVSRLDTELRSLQEAYSKQGEDLRRTAQGMEQLKAQGTPDKQHVEALHLQIQMCTEDFENERKDREKAQGRLTRLEQEKQSYIDEINRLRHSLQQLAMRPTPPRPQFQSMNIPSQPASRPNIPADRFRGQGAYNIEPEVRLNARGFRPRSPELPCDVVDSPSSWVEVDGVGFPSGHGRGKVGQPDHRPGATPSRTTTPPRSTKSPPSTTSPRSTTLLEEITMLQCPKCRKEYKPNQHNELLEHIDICC